MSKRRNRILLLGAVLILGTLCAWFAGREPKYHGRTLTQWVVAALGRGADVATLDESHTAVLVLGTNQLPELVRCVAYDADKSIPYKLISILPENITPRSAQVYLVRYLFNKSLNAGGRAEVAMEVFRILGSAGAPAVPGLTKIALSGSQVPAQRAVECLGYIGDDAIPALIMVATNSRPQNFRAFGWLVAFTNSPEAMKIVTQYSHDPSFQVLVEHPRAR